MEKQKIDIIDLFSGYGGFSLGFEQAGFEIENHYYSEIDPHAIACYKHNFPHAKYLGSVTEQSVWDIPRTGNPIIVTFGSPCQDFSLAGRREGLTGTKSSLIEHALLVVERLQPDFFIWENVKGVFSSNAGADFWAIIQAFANLGPYRLEWELVNSSWFVPQNRERVYVVGHLAVAGRSFREVFPIGEGAGGSDEGATDTPTVRTLTAGGHSGGHHSGMTLVQEATNFQGKNIANTLRSGEKGSLTDKHNWDMIQIGTLRTHKDGKGFREMQSGLSPTLGARPRQDGSGQPIISVQQINPSTESGGKQPYQQNRVYDANGISPALDQGAGRWSVQGNNKMPNGLLLQGLLCIFEEKILHASENKRNAVKVLYLLLKEIRKETLVQWEDGILSPFQTAKILQSSLYGFRTRGPETGGGGLVNCSSPCEEDKGKDFLRKVWQRTEFGCSPQGRELEEQLIGKFRSFVQELSQSTTQEKEEMSCLREGLLFSWLLRNALPTFQKIWRPNEGQSESTQSRIRRLTEIEVERLQALPDNWTKWGIYENKKTKELELKEISSTQRYKMCGNGVTVSVTEAIARKIKKYFD